MGKIIELQVDGQKVTAHYFAPLGDPRPLALLFLHGWTGRPNLAAADRLASQGFASLALIMRGHPGSEGDIKKVTAQDSLHDAMAAYDFLRGEQPDTPIAAVGNSYGCYIAVLLSQHHKLAGLSLRAPAAYPDEGFDLPKWGRGHDDPYVNEWRHKPMHFSDNIVFGLVHEFKGPIQIIQASDDEMIPEQTVLNYLEAARDNSRVEHLLMQGWPHSLGNHPKRNEIFQKTLLKWADRLASEV